MVKGQAEQGPEDPMNLYRGRITVSTKDGGSWLRRGPSRKEPPRSHNHTLPSLINPRLTSSAFLAYIPTK